MLRQGVTREMKIILPGIAERLQPLRQEQNKTQQEMANMLECTVQHYQRIEYGKVNLPSTTLIFLADYFGVTTDYLLGADGKRDSGEEMAGWYSPLRFWDKINENRSDFMHYFMQAWEYPVEDIANLWGVPVDNPEKATDEEFKDFLLSTVKAVRLNPEDGEWDVVIIPQTEKAPTPEGERPITFDDFTYAFYNESKDLPEEKKKMLLDMARFMKADLDKEKGE